MGETHPVLVSSRDFIPLTLCASLQGNHTGWLLSPLIGSRNRISGKIFAPVPLKYLSGYLKSEYFVRKKT
jgi:hypothetical protein